MTSLLKIVLSCIVKLQEINLLQHRKTVLNHEFFIVRQVEK